jgi:hypothetical protein
MVVEFKIERAVMRTLLVAALVLFGDLAKTCQGVASAAEPMSRSVIGTWHGESICVGDRPACKNEEVVYRFEAVAGKSGVVALLADKILDGKREPMGKLECQYDEAKGLLSCEFTVRQTHGLWEFKITGDTMEGTLVVLPDKSVARRVKVTRVSEDKVPSAPSRESY